MLHSSDVTIDVLSGETTYHNSGAEPWRVTMVDTGAETLTGGRLKRVRSYLGERFCMTYGDGLSDIDIRAQIDFHMKHGRAATIAAVMPPGRYGALDMTSDGVVRCFNEKPLGDEGCINGGFFVLENKVLDRIEADSTSFEGPPLEALAQEGELLGWRHPGFWHAMDTVRDRNNLEKLWATGNAPWKIWS